MRPKIGDILVYVFIVFLVGISFLGIKTMATLGDRVLVTIELDGVVMESIEISANESPREINIDTGDGGYNTIEVSKDGADMVDANCPDRLCVHSPKIKAPGQSIVCIPHRLVIKIIGERHEDNAVDDTAS